MFLRETYRVCNALNYLTYVLKLDITVAHVHNSLGGLVIHKCIQHTPGVILYVFMFTVYNNCLKLFF